MGEGCGGRRRSGDRQYSAEERSRSGGRHRRRAHIGRAGDRDQQLLPQQRDGEIAAIEDGQVESAWVAEQIGAPVYKVFNGIWWKHLLEGGKPPGAAGRIALPVAGEDGAGRDLVHDLVDQLGFDPVNAGSIAESWRQQPGTPVYGKDFDVAKTIAALAQASRERTPEWSARTA